METTIVIVIRDGLVQGIYANKDAEVIIIDTDKAKDPDAENLIQVNGEMVFICKERPLVDSNIIEQFKEILKESA